MDMQTLKSRIKLSELPKMSQGEYIYGVLPKNVKYSEEEMVEIFKDTPYRNEHNSRKPKGCKIFDHVFSNGINYHLCEFKKKELGEDTFNKAWYYYQTLSRSWGIKHEDKVAICGWLLEQLIDIDKTIKENNIR